MVERTERARMPLFGGARGLAVGVRQLSLNMKVAVQAVLTTVAARESGLLNKAGTGQLRPPPGPFTGHLESSYGARGF